MNNDEIEFLHECTVDRTVNGQTNRETCPIGFTCAAAELPEKWLKGAIREQFVKDKRQTAKPASSPKPPMSDPNKKDSESK